MPTQQIRARLRLIHARDTPEAVLVRANDHLSENQPERAVKLYTEVLYKHSPASVCAFLNRSLAYTCLDLPELAVVDAYRACMIANQMRNDADNGRTMFEAAAKYLRAEHLQVNGTAAWTSSKRRYVGGEWANSALASIVINDTPELDLENLKYEPFSTKKRQVMCAALEIRAIYRLCGALYLCGGGARHDALGLLDDADVRCRTMEQWERSEFRWLGNLILNEVSQPWDEGLSNPPGPLQPSVTERQRLEIEKGSAKESMRAKTTKRQLSGYHWDICEPELDNSDWQKLLYSWVLKSSDNCIPHIVDSQDVLDESFVPYAELRAGRDIKVGELVLSEQTKSNVSTSIPEDLFENQHPSSSRHFYCDTCASLLVVPWECPIRYAGSSAPIVSPPAPSHLTISRPTSRGSQDSEIAAYGSDNDSLERDTMMSSQPERVSASPVPVSKTAMDPLPDHSPNAEPIPNTPSEFKFCCSTHDVPTCSVICRKMREPFDRGLCHTSTERDLRNQHLRYPLIPKSLEERKKRCLVDLLFLRTFAKASNTGYTPLQDNDLVFATCGPNCRGKAMEEKDWSFTDNVVRPLHYLDRFFSQTDTDQYANLEECEGWVINTLMAKISTAMQISRTPLYARIFNDDGNLDSVMTCFDERWETFLDLHSIFETDEPWKDREPWIGSIHPVFNLIRIADVTKGEVPNVTVLRREGIICYASNATGAGIAIRKGEPLLRAPDGDPGEKTRLLKALIARRDGGGKGDVMVEEEGSGWEDEEDGGVRVWGGGCGGGGGGWDRDMSMETSDE